MALDSTADNLIAAVQASPLAVAAHDRAAWLNLFATDAVVNDPVGSRPHHGRAAIERFYDTFIGPNTIAFQVDHDLVRPPTVVRDLLIRTTMSTGATVMVPMHLRYDLVAEGDTWKITRLAAHWELAPMVLQLLRTGTPGLFAALKLGQQLITNQGFAGLLGMVQALRGVGRAGKHATRELFTAVTATDISRVRRLLDDRSVVELPAGTPISLEAFTNRARNMAWDKLIAAGRTVTASVQLDGADGVAFVEFATDTRRITALRIYMN